MRKIRILFQLLFLLVSSFISPFSRWTLVDFTTKLFITLWAVILTTYNEDKGIELFELFLY